MATLKLILKNRYTLQTGISVFFQQAAIAVGTYLMGSLAGTFASEMPSLWMLLILFLCVTLPGTLGHYLNHWSFVRMNKFTLKSYFEAYFRANLASPQQWRNSQDKLARHEVLTKTGQDAILTTNMFFLDSLATSLNVIFNTVAVILVTNKMVGGAIVIGGLVGFFLIHLNDKKIAATADGEMKENTALNAQLSRSWDNIVIGNTLHSQRWLARFESTFARSANAAFASSRVQDGAVSLAGLLTNVIVVGAVLGLTWMNRFNTAFAVSLLVMLPRSLTTTLHLQIIQGYWAQWKSLRQKLDQVDQSFQAPKADSLAQYIQEDRIQIRGEELVNQASLLQATNGRFVITGENGAGKSTMLLSLKNKFGEKAAYLPAHHQLETAQESAAHSSGQLAMAHLDELEGADCEVLLLDEWDANLSHGNRKVYDAKIQAMSKRKLVVEIRHSHTS